MVICQLDIQAKCHLAGTKIVPQNKIQKQLYEHISTIYIKNTSREIVYSLQKTEDHDVGSSDGRKPGNWSFVTVCGL